MGAANAHATTAFAEQAHLSDYHKFDSCSASHIRQLCKSTDEAEFSYLNPC